MPIAEIKGHVHYRTREGLPPCMLAVELYDASLPDGPNPVIASATRLVPANGSLSYTLIYDTDQIEAGHDYALGASIHVGERLYKCSTTHHGVSLPATTERAILVEFAQVGATQASADAASARGGFRADSPEGVHGGNLTDASQGIQGGNLIDEANATGA
ncbi:YbaY family lipoprotein [Pseudomonas sp. DC3000-4b1]|uniref:YbaY family lipoprotein n=1 Tax=unclassified Pseudomonas TaxID=196821 RepID=UPI003CEE4F06